MNEEEWIGVEIVKNKTWANRIRNERSFTLNAEQGISKREFLAE